MATTLYGTWCNRIDGGSSSPDDEVHPYLGEHVDAFDVEAICRDYREAIDAVLPAGLTLHGDEFLGPIPNGDGDERIDVDWEALGRAIEAIDLGEICQRHELA
ncbi:hypothetical protein ACP6C7_03820 [Mycolicibacterium septicum]|uniref:Uncharacterized protein n=1 Tax=Mycolicibacterium septicum TaxID=98668 RepID=A0ABW9LNH7_9MYCO